MHRQACGAPRSCLSPTTLALLMVSATLAGCGAQSSTEPLGGAEAGAALFELSASSATDLTPPFTPSNLSWAASGMTVILSWGASTDDVGVAGYQLFYGNFLLGTFTDTSLALIGFKVGTPYDFTVRAVDAAGNVSVASNRTTVLLQQTGPDTTPPTAPGVITTTSIGSTSVALRWVAATDDVGVVVYQLYANGALAGLVPMSTVGTISGLQPGTTYTLFIRAADAAGNISPSSDAVTIVTAARPPDTTPPSTPKGLTVTGVTATSVVLSWTASTDDVGVTEYDVALGSSNTAAMTAFTSVAVSGLAPGTTFTFAVQARDAAGNWSAKSSPISATTLAAGGGGGGGGGGACCSSTSFLVNAGGPVTGDFLADVAYSGGSTSSSTNVIDTSAIARWVPQAVFQSERYGEFTYSFPYPAAGSYSTVTLYFAETHLTAAGQRTFDVVINGSTVLAGFDIFAAAGGANKALAKDFVVYTGSGSQITVQFTSGGGAGSPEVSAISVAPGAMILIPTSLAPPTRLKGQSDGKSASLSWVAADGSSAYLIERDSMEIGTSYGTSYADSTVTAGTTYSYRVRATNINTTSEPSNAVSVTVP